MLMKQSGGRTPQASTTPCSPADTLNLRAEPSARARVVAPLPLLSEGVRFVGGACRVDGVLWLEVEHGERRGWVNERFVSPVGAFEDVATIAEAPVSDNPGRPKS